MPVRINKIGAAIVALALTSGCALSTRTLGMQDPSVEITRALAASQTAAIKALTDALTAAATKACTVPEVR
jgi:hypothetical protein